MDRFQITYATMAGQLYKAYR